MITEIIDQLPWYMQLLVGPQTMLLNLLIAAAIGYAFIVNAPTLERWLNKRHTKTE
jgi:hypothetical protein